MKSPFKHTILTLSSFLLLAFHASAEENFITNGDFSKVPHRWSFSTSNEEVASFEAIVQRVKKSPKGEPNFPANAIFFNLNPPTGSKPYAHQMARGFSLSVLRGTELKLTFWARSDDDLRIIAAMAEVPPPYAAFAVVEASLSSKWTQYEVVGTAPRDFAVREAGVRFELGNLPGTVEITGIQVTKDKK